MPGGVRSGVGGYPVQVVYSDSCEQAAEVRALAEAAGESLAETQRTITRAGLDQVRAAYAMRGVLVRTEDYNRHLTELREALKSKRGGQQQAPTPPTGQ